MRKEFHDVNDHANDLAETVDIDLLGEWRARQVVDARRRRHLHRLKIRMRGHRLKDQLQKENLIVRRVRACEEEDVVENFLYKARPVVVAPQRFDQVGLVEMQIVFGDRQRDDVLKVVGVAASFRVARIAGVEQACRVLLVREE